MTVILCVRPGGSAVRARCSVLQHVVDVALGMQTEMHIRLAALAGASSSDDYMISWCTCMMELRTVRDVT